MAASSIKSDLGKLLVNLAVHKVEDWARKEFNSIRHHSKLPVFLELNEKTWAIGTYELEQLGAHKWRVTRDDKLVHIFYNKQAAVYYTVLSKLRYFKTADSLLVQDSKVGKYCTDFEFYSTRLKSTKIDNFRYQLFLSKYLEAKSKFDLSRLELEKTLQNAKYNKIWDNIYEPKRIST